MSFPHQLFRSYSVALLESKKGLLWHDSRNSWPLDNVNISATADSRQKTLRRVTEFIRWIASVSWRFYTRSPIFTPGFALSQDWKQWVRHAAIVMSKDAVLLSGRERGEEIFRYPPEKGKSYFGGEGLNKFRSHSWYTYKRYNMCLKSSHVLEVRYHLRHLTCRLGNIPSRSRYRISLFSSTGNFRVWMLVL
jgi:hypothetical protein